MNNGEGTRLPNTEGRGHRAEQKPRATYCPPIRQDGASRLVSTTDTYSYSGSQLWNLAIKLRVSLLFNEDPRVVKSQRARL